MRKKQRSENPKLLTAQEFINVEDITDHFLYSTDGYLFGFLSIRAGDNKLMSPDEKVREAENITASLAGETEPWQILSVPRTVDTLGMISQLTELRHSVKEDARLKLINGEIAALQEMTREGTKEPMLVLKCWVKAARGADAVLNKRLYDLRSRLVDNRISCEIMSAQEITYLCKVFSDLSTFHGQDDIASDVPILEGEPRQYSLSENGTAELLELITPVGGISFQLSSVTVGSVVGRVYGAVRYPSELDYGWAVDLLNVSDTVTCTTYFPGNPSLLGDALSRSIKRSDANANSESDVRRRKRFERQAQDADRLIDEMDARSAAIGHLSLLVMPFTTQQENLEDVCHAVLNRYSRKRIKLRCLGAMQKEAFKQLSPYHIPQPQIQDIIQHIMPLKTLLGGSPMVVNIYRDDNGFYFGRTIDGSIISIDFLRRHTDRTNSNIVAVGAAGSGKSTALKSVAETLYMSGVKVIVIDPEREFRELCQNLSGTWLDAGGGTAKVNPLQIRAVPEDEDNSEGQEQLYQSNDNAMALHIHTLEVFFKLYLPSLTDLQRALVKKALVALYEKFNIHWDTDITTLSPTAFPLFEDFYRLLLELAKADPRYEEISALFYDLAEGADSFLWNGATNVEMDNNFIVLDTNRLQNSSDEVKRSQYFNILTLCWDIISADRTKPVFLLCDEAHILLDPSIPQTAMYLRNMAKRSRKYEGMLGVVTQSVVDFLHDDIRLYGQAILDNATYKFLFSADGRNLQETAEIFQLTSAEQNILLNGERGKALCLIGRQHIHVDFALPAYKLELMGRGGGR